jgi:hypothetical protein
MRRCAASAQGSVGLLKRGNIRQKLGVNFEFEFLNCSIVGECLVHGFDKFVQNDVVLSNNTGGVAWARLPVKKSFRNGMGRIFVIP